MAKVITATDVIEAGYCIKQGLKPFLRRHKIDYITFLKEGLAVDEAIKLDNVMVNRIIENKYGK